MRDRSTTPGDAPRARMLPFVFAVAALGAGAYILVTSGAAAPTHTGAVASAALAAPTARTASRRSPASIRRSSRPTPSAGEFAAQLVGAANRYAAEHGDPRRLADADCVEPSAGRYMCSYATKRPGAPDECHIMQGRWTPDAASSFTVTLSGRTMRCGSLREALRSLP